MISEPYCNGSIYPTKKRFSIYVTVYREKIVANRVRHPVNQRKD